MEDVQVAQVLQWHQRIDGHQLVVRQVYGPHLGNISSADFHNFHQDVGSPQRGKEGFSSEIFVKGVEIYGRVGGNVPVGHPVLDLGDEVVVDGDVGRGSSFNDNNEIVAVRELYFLVEILKFFKQIIFRLINITNNFSRLVQ